MTGRLFHDLDSFVAAPRIAALELSPDGQRLVVSVHTLDAKGTGYIGSLWELDTEGVRQPHQLTRGTTSESMTGFTPEGDLLFTAKRPVPPTRPGDTDSAGSDDDPPALWLLPRSGEARCLLTRAGGIGDIAIASSTGLAVISAPTLPNTSIDDPGADDLAARDRAASKVSAILHDSYPVRYWDHDIGPASSRLYLADPAQAPVSAEDDEDTADGGLLRLRDLTGHLDGALGDEATFDVTADGSVIVTDWSVPEAAASVRTSVTRIHTETGERSLLGDDVDREYESPRISPDGTTVVMLHSDRSAPDRSPDIGLSLVAIDGGEIRTIADDWDLWPARPRWTPDGASLVVAVDEDGRGPLYLVDAQSGDRRRLTTDDGTYASHHVAPDGHSVFALRTTIGEPPQPVRISIADGEIVDIPSPVSTPELPGSLAEVRTIADDGTPLRSWLAVPHGASADDPAPLLLWIHGGPLASWNAWSWRWNPWTAVARGYAVLLPDPALSTGYGRDFIDRGWGSWGDAPFTDLMAVTDATVARDDIDESRTAAMGGSFGGYMANWVAGHTDRFDAIVTHASLWALDQFGPTTDAAFYWAREMTAEMAAANSPHVHVDKITTPTLVIHGDKDYRVPIGEGLRLWFELVRQSADDDGKTPHRFLYFPDENHWILSPNNARAWYATVFEFLAQHVLGGDWQQPDELMS